MNIDDFSAGARQGLANHAAAAGQINSAIAGEMQSRVAQAREKRRMEHERDMKKMELDAILARLDAASKSKPSDGPAPRAVFPGGAIY